MIEYIESTKTYVTKRINNDGESKKHARKFRRGGKWTTLHNDENVLVRELLYQPDGTTEKEDCLGMVVVVFKKTGKMHWFFNQTPPFSNFTSSTLPFRINRMDGTTVVGSVGSSEHAFLLMTLLAFGFLENRDAAFRQYLNPEDEMRKVTQSKNLLKKFPADFYDSIRFEYMETVYALKLIIDEDDFDEVVNRALEDLAAHVADFEHVVYEVNPNCDLWAIKLPYYDTTDFRRKRDATGKIVKSDDKETTTGFYTLLMAAIANDRLHEFFQQDLPKHGKNMLGKVVTPLFSEFLNNREDFKAKHGAELIFGEKPESVIMDEIFAFYKEPREGNVTFNAYREDLKQDYPEETKDWA